MIHKSMEEYCKNGRYCMHANGDICGYPLFEIFALQMTLAFVSLVMLSFVNSVLSDTSFEARQSLHSWLMLSSVRI